MKATIIGTGSYIPEYILTNQELSTMVETDDEWIVTRTGISERRIQKSGDVADMAVNAALKALDNAGINSEDIDLIIAATSTPDYLFPSCSLLSTTHAPAPSPKRIHVLLSFQSVIPDIFSLHTMRTFLYIPASM